jgi:hypothetical protein
VKAALRLALHACLLGACADTTDIYIGSDNPVTAPGSGSGSAAGAPEPPAREPTAPGGDAAISSQRPAEPQPPPLDAGERDSGADGGGSEAGLDAGAPPAAQCSPGTEDCDGDPSNGCEVDTQSDMQHCGGCDRLCHADGHDALGAECVAGRCQITCSADPFGDHDCDFDPDNGCETRFRTDDQNCGGCGVVCTCFNGACL